MILIIKEVYVVNKKLLTRDNCTGGLLSDRYEVILQ